MDLARLIVYPLGHAILECKKYSDLEKDWVDGSIYAGQLKEALASQINVIIAPIRQQILDNIDLYNRAFQP